MRLPSIPLGVTAKQLLVLVTLGGIAVYLFSNQDEITPENLALQTFIRAQERVGEQVGAVVDITLVRQVVAYPGYAAPGYTRSVYAVEGERGRLMVTLKQMQGGQGIEVTQISQP